MNKKFHPLFLLLLSFFYISSAQAEDLPSIKFHNKSSTFCVEVTNFECPKHKNEITFLPSKEAKSGSTTIQHDQSITLGEITLKEQYTESYCTLVISGNIISGNSKKEFIIRAYSSLTSNRTTENDQCFVSANRAVLHTDEGSYYIPLSDKKNQLIITLPDDILEQALF